MRARSLQDHALAHRNDEFPAGYSSAGCSPAEPASASPASAIMLWLIFSTKIFTANGKLSLIPLSQPKGAVLVPVPGFPRFSAAETPLRVVRVGWVGLGAATVRCALQGSPLVSGLLVQDTQAVFKSAGSEEDLADILAALVSAGVKVVSFGEVKQTVEDLYLKLSHHEVM